MNYKNIEPILGLIISKKLATLKELEEYYSLEDVIDLLEIIEIDCYNEFKQAESVKNG
jgi:hypothetical protein